MHEIPAVNPLPLWELAHRYCEARAFHAASELDIFSKLDTERTSDEVANMIGLHHRPVRMLMDACVALGLLEKCGRKYRNTAVASEFLVKGKPFYSGNFVSLEAFSYQSWAKLPDAARENKPVARIMRDERHMKFFTHAMHSTSVFSATILAQAVDLSGHKRLLDIGGGSGVNAITVAEKYQNLRATVFDQGPVVEVAAEYIAKSLAAPRISTMAGDYLKGLPGGHDAALLSNILHGEGAEDNRALLKRVYDALEAPGMVIIADTLPNEERTGPVFPLLFALNELLYTEHGDTYTESDIKGFLAKAGFGRMNAISFEPAPLSVITALKGA
ncbi:MAG: methyltransferase [Candidatus Abyssobacteria bacterium SURF_17]|uniref:Methyltransferase n=1 Tax=Candidatus Abyssobacteria bacterium SURF_17 TaxID=2093361 RepID=A0A419EXN1_9BACT|nr:MAG: methyltransferase [Candidatus Abyssubacteria bacterium SURF_17]